MAEQLRGERLESRSESLLQPSERGGDRWYSAIRQLAKVAATFTGFVVGAAIGLGLFYSSLGTPLGDIPLKFDSISLSEQLPSNPTKAQTIALASIPLLGLSGMFIGMETAIALLPKK